MKTCRKIVNWKKTLHIPSEANLSRDAKDLILKLIADSSKRLTFEKLKKHPFFKKIDCKNIRQKKAAFVPKLSYFSFSVLCHFIVHVSVSVSMSVCVCVGVCGCGCVCVCVCVCVAE
jgi:hypothetical protein